MTAEIFAARIGCGPVVLDPRLRERFFGELDGGKDDQYDNVWQKDRDSADHVEFGCESVNSVIARASELVTELDAEGGGGKVVILVAHGDVIQITQTAFKGMRGEEHRSLPHLDTAGYRKFN